MGRQPNTLDKTKPKMDVQTFRIANRQLEETRHDMEKLRSERGSGSPREITRFSVLAALMWATIMGIRVERMGLPDITSCSLFVMVNLRERLPVLRDTTNSRFMNLTVPVRISTTVRKFNEEYVFPLPCRSHQSPHAATASIQLTLFFKYCFRHRLRSLARNITGEIRNYNTKALSQRLDFLDALKDRQTVINAYIHNFLHSWGVQIYSWSDISIRNHVLTLPECECAPVPVRQITLEAPGDPLQGLRGTILVLPRRGNEDWDIQVRLEKDEMEILEQKLEDMDIYPASSSRHRPPN